MRHIQTERQFLDWKYFIHPICSSSPKHKHDIFRPLRKHVLHVCLYSMVYIFCLIVTKFMNFYYSVNFCIILSRKYFKFIFYKSSLFSNFYIWFYDSISNPSFTFISAYVCADVQFTTSSSKLVIYFFYSEAWQMVLFVI